MKLNRKTTILLSPELHARLTRIAAQRGTSLGSLVREASEREYGESTRKQRLEPVKALADLRLPVSSPEEMARESVPSPGDLWP